MAGFDDAHIHPWYYYIRIMLLPDDTYRHAWSEVWLLIPACYGLIKAFTGGQRDFKKDLVLFSGCYSLMFFILISLIPYKTPCNMLQVYPGIILSAAFGIVEFTRIRTAPRLKISIPVLILAAFIHWTWMSWQMNFIYHTDPANPWVYAHTGPDVFKLKDKVDRVAAINPDKQDMSIDVIFPENDYWPLHWYLRQYTNTGYWDLVDTTQAPSTLIITTPALEKDLVRKLYELPPPGQRYLYVQLSDSVMELRPGVEMQAWLRKDIWDMYREVPE